MLELYLSKNRNNKCALYLRTVITDDIDGCNSLYAQLLGLTRYCCLKGWDCFEVYKDEGFSGDDLNRPALKHMLSLLSKIT